MYKVEDITFDKRDEYTRKNIAENIYHSISSGEFYSPCLLDGQWGSGKTEFCHKLHNYIIEQNSANASKEEFKLVPIYINVFNAERINNPFLSLMGGLVGSACNGIIVPASLIETASKILSTEVALKPIGIGMAKDITGLLLSKIKEYAPQTTDAVINQITDGFNNEFSNGLFEKAFEEVNKLDKKYQDFSKELANFATEKTPIIFVIDELDRCRPNFAIQFLECIKHFFNVDNVYFLLSCNVDQLIASINHLYGEKINGENYLEKFFEDMIPLKNNLTNQQANIKILSNFPNFPFLNYFHHGIIDFLFETVTLRGQHKIFNKYQQLKLELHKNKPDQQFIYDQLDNAQSDDRKLSDIIIFSFAYLISHQQLKDITFNKMIDSDVFDKMLTAYCINLSGSRNPELSDIYRAKDILIQSIKHTENQFNKIIKKITYS